MRWPGEVDRDQHTPGDRGAIDLSRCGGHGRAGQGDSTGAGSARTPAGLDRLTRPQRPFVVIAVLAAITGALAGRSRDKPARWLAPLFRRIGSEAIEDTGAMLAEVERQRRELERSDAKIVVLQGEVARAEAANTAKSELLANMSHELRTPLSAIIGFSEIIRSESLGPVGNRTYRNYINDISFCAEHLLGIVNDTLDIARHEAGKVELTEGYVAIDAVVREACRLLAPQAERGRVTLSWRPARGDLPGLYADRVRLRQILLNVLSNAIKFTEPGGQVEISTDLSDGVALVVTDTGIGIEPDDISVALSRFGRVSPIEAQTPQGTGSHRGIGWGQGTGLGLTLAKALAEQHDGSLTLQSTPQVGTIVRISFPVWRVVPRDRGDAAKEMRAAV
jgi:signal transduction histidine kinase